MFAMDLLEGIVAYDKKADFRVDPGDVCRRLCECFIIFLRGDARDHANYLGVFWEAELCQHGLLCLASNSLVGRVRQNINAVIDDFRAARRQAVAESSPGIMRNEDEFIDPAQKVRVAAANVFVTVSNMAKDG